MKRFNNVFDNSDDDEVKPKPLPTPSTLKPMFGFKMGSGAISSSLPLQKQQQQQPLQQLQQQQQPFKKQKSLFDDEDDSSSLSPNKNNNSNKMMSVSPTANKQIKEDEDDEVDPLDAFMENVHKEVQVSTTSTANNQNTRAKRDDIEEEDEEEKFFKLRKQQIDQQNIQQSNSNINNNNNPDIDEDDYDPLLLQDSDDEDNIKNSSATTYRKKTIIEPLPPLDHSKIQYFEFEKCFYEECSDISALSTERVFQLRKELDIRINGKDLVNPVTSFGHFGFDYILIQSIQKQGYESPTSIQKQAVPIAMSGRDLIAIAKTGSGKTASFIWPAIPHIMDQPYLEKGDGPIAVFVAPTRELAHQIYIETQKFAKPYKIRTSVIYGGVTKLLQCRELKAGCEILVTTPGRLIDMIKLKATKMNRVTYLVLDEADRMFDMGFGPQVQSIVGQIRPDRQTLLFSATFPPNIEELARNILIEPIRISIGNTGGANQDITQIVDVLDSSAEKWDWITQRLPSFINQGNVIIFVSTKVAVDELSMNLIKFGFPSEGLHGDKDQQERTNIINRFKDGSVPILVATDVAARGLDINLIKNVVNFDTSRDIDSHTHRIGRTGRAGTQGVAYTLVTPKDINFSAELVKHLEEANQIVPPELVSIAMNNNQFRRERSGDGSSRRGGRGRGRGGRSGGRGGRGGNRGAGVGYRNNNSNNYSDNIYSSKKQQSHSNNNPIHFVPASENTTVSNFDKQDDDYDY